MTTDTAQAPTTALKRCFSGSGKYANRKWAAGGDATYLSRLRKAHLAGEQVPDPWFIQEHGGVEAENVPEDGWPQMDPMDVARRLDQERGGGVDSHWVHTLEVAAEKAEAKKRARSEREAVTAASKKEKEEERARQKMRPKRGTKVIRLGGEHDGQEASVVRTISPTQLLISYTDGGLEELVTDEDIEPAQPAEGEQPEDEQTEQEQVEQPEGEFQEA